MKATNNIRLAVLAITVCIASIATAQTTYKGFRAPQLSTADRALIGAETNAEKAKGLQIFNTTTGQMEYWDGAKWTQMSSGGIKAENGLSMPNEETVKLGGTLNQETTINLSGNDLIFNPKNIIFTNENVGIGTASPKAPLHVESATGDPLILENLKWTSEPKNNIDAADPTYYNLQISDAGVIRKSPPIVPPYLMEDLTYDLRSNTDIKVGDENGAGGSDLVWVRGGVNQNFIMLPENGTYIFSLQLSGKLSALGMAARGYSYYVCAYVNGTGIQNLVDIAEIIIFRSSYTTATYTICMTVAGKAGDQVYIKLGAYSGTGTPWTLSARAGLNDHEPRTFLMYWKI